MSVMNVATQDIHLSALPPIAPETVEETGLGTAFLVELACKILYAGGTMALASLSDRLALPVSVTVDIAEILKKERLAEVKKGGTSGPPTSTRSRTWGGNGPGSS